MGKRAHCTDRRFLWSQEDLGVLLKWVLANECWEEVKKPEPHHCGGLTLSAHQMPTFHSPSMNRTGERKYDKNLMGQDKDREVTYQLPSRADSTYRS